MILCEPQRCNKTSVRALTDVLLQRCGSQRITDVQRYGDYGTVALRFDGILVDLASARREIYLVPAQNPKVEPGTLEQDLLRRDFTINAMAMALIVKSRRRRSCSNVPGSTLGF